MYVPLIDLFYKLSQEVFKLALLFLVLIAKNLMPALVEKSTFTIMRLPVFEVYYSL